MKGLGVAKGVKGIGFWGVWGELGLGGGFRGQSVAGYLGLGLALVLVWGGWPLGGLVTIFPGSFASAGGVFVLWGEGGALGCRGVSVLCDVF